MLIPVGEEVSVPVTVVVLGPEPEVVSARLCRLEEGELLVEMSRPAPVGTRVIVTAGDRIKLPGRVLDEQDGRWVVSREGVRATDDRAAPRFATVLDLRWRVAEADGPRWIAGGTDPGPFVSFQGPADLSLSGLCFDCSGLVPQVGTQLLLALALAPDHPERRHRALGAVRRIEAGHERILLGVEFVDLPESTFDALSDYTLRNL
ncbi:MAG: PilZ domain-containing protein [Myxococcota bacterium]